MVAKINPLNSTQFDRLMKSIDWSNRMLVFPRKRRLSAIKQLVGFHYAEQGSDRRVIVPTLKMIIDIHVRLLAARSPRALFSTQHQDLKWTAANLELAVNQVPCEIDLDTTLRRLVLEALFSIGIAKVGLHTVGRVLGHEYGAPFVDVITIDDAVLDMAAKHRDQMQYMGNDYWLNYEDVMESKSFPKKSLEDLHPDDFTVTSEEGEERAEGISISESAELFKKKIQLRDVFLPAEKLFVTYAVKTKRRLKVIEWEGPERGPYSILGFGDVCGNLLPLPPVAGWRDMHELGNAIYRKLADQADAQKTVPAFSGDDDQAVEDFAAARDGQGIKFTGQPPVNLKTGGIDPSTLAFFLQNKDLSSYYAGNLDALGGLSPQSKTVGQDKLISEASGAQIREMAAQVMKFTKNIFESLAYYEWYDPIRRRLLNKSIPGTDLEIVVPWDRASRRGEFDLYDLEVDVFSAQDDSPNARLQRFAAVMQQYVLPLLGAIEAAGGVLDIQSLFEIIAKYSDLDELRGIVQFIDRPESASSDKTIASLQNITRQTERINRPGATAEGKSAVMQQVLLGGRPQRDEMATIGRATS